MYSGFVEPQQLEHGLGFLADGPAKSATDGPTPRLYVASAHDLAGLLLFGPNSSKQFSTTRESQSWQKRLNPLRAK
jgi:hypothetical protein